MTAISRKGSGVTGSQGVVKEAPKRLVRLQFDLSEQRYINLENAVARSGVSTKKEYIENALAFLDWAIKESAQGRKIASISDDNGTWRELQMPILINARHEVPS